MLIKPVKQGVFHGGPESYKSRTLHKKISHGTLRVGTDRKKPTWHGIKMLSGWLIRRRLRTIPRDAPRTFYLLQTRPQGGRDKVKDLS